jgi:energy-coupling factor transport system ATP-binding protein
MPRELLSTQNLRVAFKGSSQDVLKNISFELTSGESIGIIGNNGSGKSTLAQTLLGIVPNLYPAKISGTIRAEQNIINTLSISDRLNFIGYSFQNVDTQVLFGRAFQILGIEETGTNLEIIEMGIEILKLQPILNKLPNEISGGEAQKLALVAALRRSPQTIIYDEATTALDPVIRQQFGRLVQELQEKEHGLILIAQSTQSIEKYSSKILYLNNGVLDSEPSPDRSPSPINWLPTVFENSLEKRPCKIEINNVKINRNDRRLSEHQDSRVSLNIEAGEVIAIVGANGCGKSTLIQKIAGYLKSPDNEINFFDSNNQPLKNSTLTVGLLFQNPSYQLIESSIEEHLCSHIPEKLASQRQKILQEIQECFPFFIMDSDPLQLSYGQQKILSIISLIVSNKSLVLLDEPEQGLDPHHIGFLQHWFKKNQETKNQTILYVTHDMELASDYSDRVVMLNSGTIFKIFDAVTSTQLEENFEYLYTP